MRRDKARGIGAMSQLRSRGLEILEKSALLGACALNTPPRRSNSRDDGLDPFHPAMVHTHIPGSVMWAALWRNETDPSTNHSAVRGFSSSDKDYTALRDDTLPRAN